MAYMDLDTGARERTPRTTAYAPPPQTVEPPAPVSPTYGAPQPAAPTTAATQPAGGAQNWGNYNPYYQGGANPYGSGGYTGPYQGPNYASQQLQSGMYGAAPGTAGYQLPPTPATSAPPTSYNTAGLEGFDSGKLNDPTHQTAKYEFARLASNYQPTAQGFGQLIADPKFGQLGFQSVGNGNIRLPNGEIVDVVRAFQEGGKAWQWGTSGGVESGQFQALPKDYGAQYGASAQPQVDPWQQYYKALADWQTKYGQPAQQAPAAQPAAQPPPTQVWEAPSVPEGATAYPQGGYQQDYPGYAYNAGYTPLPGGYMPQAAYNTGWYPGPGSYDPTAQAFSYLGQGMFPGTGY